MREPRLWLTCMSGPGNLDNAREIVEPIHSHLDGTIWVLNDCPTDDPGALYLESVKGAGRIIHRAFHQRYHHLMNETLFCGLIEEGDWVLFVDALERPMPDFVSRIKSEIGPLMVEADLDLILYFGKPYLLRYRETMEYRNSPHWSLSGHNGRAIEWSQNEPDEKKVRWNVRPIKRTDKFHWVSHFLKYHMFPAGSNSAAMGLDHWPGGLAKQNENWLKRESSRLTFRAEMRKRGYPLTVDGFVAMCRETMDDQLKDLLRTDKVWSDAYHYLVLDDKRVKDSHNPAEALPIE